MKKYIVLSLACCLASFPATAEPTALGDCRDQGFYVDTVIVSDELQSPRQFADGMVTLFLLQTNHSPYGGAGFAIVYYPGEGENLACMGREMFSSVDLARATADFVEGEGLTVTIPGSYHNGGFDEESGLATFNEVITTLRYNPSDGSLTELSGSQQTSTNVLISTPRQ